MKQTYHNRFPTPNKYTQPLSYSHSNFYPSPPIRMGVQRENNLDRSFSRSFSGSQRSSRKNKGIGVSSKIFRY